MERVFLGLERPALHSAAEFLLKRYARGKVLDLRHVTVVLPVSRAGRRLLEILVERCEAKGVLLTPPVIETVGRLPEQLYVPKRPFANPLVQDLAWTQAVRSVPLDELRPLLPNPPEANEDERWLELGQALRRQHLELAGDGLNFRDVARRGAELDWFPETARWTAMANVQDAYHQLLDGVALWDRQTARLVAIRQGECQTERKIVVLGAVDMNVTLRQMLDAVADSVTVLIFAGEEWAERFDRHGCLIPEHWRNVSLPILADHTHVVNGPTDQAETALRCLARYAGRYRSDEITIGVPDDRLTPDLARVLRESGLETRWGPGRPLLESSPCRMLAAVADYLMRRPIRDFAALARHPDIQAWLMRRGVQGDYLSELDAYWVEHLPDRLDGSWLGAATGSGQLRAVHRIVSRWLLPLDAPAQAPSHWGAPLLQLLTEVYGARELDRDRSEDRATIVACQELRRVVSDCLVIPQSFAPRLTAAHAIQLMLEQLATETVPPPSEEEAIELLGWLELPLDDAPALIVTSLNEGIVPDSVSSDLFLPNRLRSQLGLLDNDRRYARDAYALSALLAVRERIDLIVARRNHDGDPLIPSRLLFAGDAETAARRAAVLFQPTPPSRVTRREAVASGGLLVPRPQPLATPISRLRVTSFRDYIACPYRFYLRHVLRLERLEDQREELDGAAFGSLAHEVLRRFGNSPERDATDAAEIRALLQRELADCVANAYGSGSLAIVQVQAEQLRLRLDAFAERQADWAAAGWRIAHIEVPSGEGPPPTWQVDDQPIELGGRIDRIDVHAETGQIVVFDYKTSDTPKSPREAHQRRDEWVDLQLPLYRHLVRSLGIHQPVGLGYIVLPKDTSRVGFCLAEWSEEELRAADRSAIEIVRAIRNEAFWPPTQPAPDYFDEFAAICQDHVS